MTGILAEHLSSRLTGLVNLTVKTRHRCITRSSLLSSSSSSSNASGRKTAIPIQHPAAPLFRNNDNFIRTSRSFTSVTEIDELPPILPNPPIPPAPLLHHNSDDTADGAQRSTHSQTKSLWQRFSDKYSLAGQQERIRRGETLFQAATRQASDPRWFGPGRIGREFRPRHAVLTLHVWLLHKRLLVDSYDQSAALKVDEELFSILWDDTTCRIRQTGVMELAVNKNLMQVQQYTFLHLTHYDHVYTQFLDQPAERLKELRNLVWHHWLLRDPDGEKRTDHLDRICWYIDANYRNILHEWPDEYYRSSRVAWVDLPDFTNIRKADHNHHTNEDDKADDDDDGGSSGSLFLPERPLHPDDVLPHPWLRNITNRGVEYYWNPNTGESTWERPTQ